MEILRYTEFVLRILFFLCFAAVLFLCFASLFRKKHGVPVLARLINSANGDEFEIASWEISIGRAKSCDIVLAYTAVSRFHAVIARRGKSWQIFDTNSRTGVLVNGEKIERSAQLYDGDTVILGNAVLNFSAPLFRRTDKEGENAFLRDTGELESPAAAMPALVDLSDGSVRLLFADSYTMGRGTDCDIVFPVMSVSRHHARLFHDGSVWCVEDMASKSGTLINNIKIKNAEPLYEGDVVSLGGVRMKLTNDYAEPGGLHDG